MIAARIEAALERGESAPIVAYVEKTTAVNAVRAAALEAATADRDADELLLIAADGAPPWSKAVVGWSATRASRVEVGCRVTLFAFEETLWDCAKHSIVPVHEILTGDALEAFLKRAGGLRRALETCKAILETDTQCRRLGARAGAFVACGPPTRDVMVVRSALGAHEERSNEDLDDLVDQEAEAAVADTVAAAMEEANAIAGGADDDGMT